VYRKLGQTRMLHCMLQPIRNCIIGPFEFTRRQFGWVKLAVWTKPIGQILLNLSTQNIAAFFSLATVTTLFVACPSTVLILFRIDRRKASSPLALLSLILRGGTLTRGNVTSGPRLNLQATKQSHQHTTHNTQHTTHNTQHTTHNTQHTTHNTQPIQKGL
jgi:hypothetical protein